MKHLYKAEMTVTAYVVLDTQDVDFHWEAREAIRHEVANVDAIHLEKVQKGDDVPRAWSLDCLVYGTDEDTTLAEAIERYGVPQ